MQNKLIPTITLITITFFLSFQLMAGDIKDASFYLSIDVDKIRSNEIYNLIKEKARINGAEDGLNFNGKDLPKEISYITFYGEINDNKNGVALIYGDFRNFSLFDYLSELAYSKDVTSNLIKDSQKNYNGRVISVISIQKDTEASNQDYKNVYLTQIDNDLTVVSLNQQEVKNWIDNKYDNTDVSNGSLFSVVVDIKSAMAHLGVNIDEEASVLHSELLKKVSQISSSITEINSELHINIALTTDDETTAGQIVMIANGLIAMKALTSNSQDNPEIGILLDNLSIIQDGNNVLIKSNISIDKLLEKIKSNLVITAY